MDADRLAAGTIGDGVPSDFPDTLAFVTPPWSGGGTYTYPTLDFDVTSVPPATGTTGATTFSVKVKNTTSADAINPCIVPPVGDHKSVGSSPTETRSSVVYQRYIRLDATWRARVAASEQEHLDDLVRAYDLSLAAAATAVNSLGTKEYKAATADEAKQQAKTELAGPLHAKLTADPATWRTVVMSLGQLSGSERDAQGTHSYGVEFDSRDAAAKKAFYKLNAGTTRSIPATTVVQFSKI